MLKKLNKEFQSGTLEWVKGTDPTLDILVAVPVTTFQFTFKKTNKQKTSDFKDVQKRVEEHI